MNTQSFPSPVGRARAEAYLDRLGEQLAHFSAANPKQGAHTLRWGGTQQYNFLQSPTPPTPPALIPYLPGSALLVHANESPRAWAVLMQCSFDQNSEWAASHGSVWLVEFQLLVGVGQANVQMSDYWQGNPVDGFTRQGDASAAPPFSVITSQWPSIPAAQINARVFISGNQSGSPAPFTGGVAGLAAPVMPSGGV